MQTRNVNVRTAAQESSRKIGGESAPYRSLVDEGGEPIPYIILVADKPKKSDVAEEWDVMEFSGLEALKNYRRRCPEKMSCIYGYALSIGLDKQFHHISLVEAEHFKQFVREIRSKGIAI